YGFAMEVSVRGTTFHSQPEGLRDSVYAKAIEARHDGWRKRLPGKVADLWDGLAALTGPEQAELFAHCASFGVNALYEKADRYGGRVSAPSIDQR
ncbi:DNA-binding protein, partial [Salmonella enterica subsp. enterica serovar Heidelberg]|nr:DNA-binding protein [Salmonella enterica subsp. enterica serovar Heidelberg]